MKQIEIYRTHNAHRKTFRSHSQLTALDIMERGTQAHHEIEGRKFYFVPPTLSKIALAFSLTFGFGCFFLMAFNMATISRSLAIKTKSLVSSNLHSPFKARSVRSKPEALIDSSGSKLPPPPPSPPSSLLLLAFFFHPIPLESSTPRDAKVVSGAKIAG